MAKIKVKISNQGARAVLNSAEVQRDLLARAERIRDGAGIEGYVADVQPGRSRAHAMVKTETFEARRDNARNQTLLKNLDRGR
ncbi:hypothetical protein [Glutamicibacter sp. AOP3-A1-12]|uniref:hypothetical protein n=1 Tax=Glutamicibacter sp. AOP3-A1-12 TaxID=3457701 RepID=UPI004034E92F